VKKAIISKPKFNILILLSVFTIIFSSLVFAENSNAGFMVKCGNLYGTLETLAIAHEDLVPMDNAVWTLYKTLEIRVKIYSNDDYDRLKGKWLGLTLKNGDNYVDVPAIKVTGKTSIFRLEFSKFAHLFNTGDYSVTVAGWEDYDSENDRMIGEIWRLNCNGSMWMPLIRYTEY